MDKRDYYDVLGVSRSADEKEIKKAFKGLAKKYHPDVSKEQNADQKFKEAQEAYGVLSDVQKRQQYDQFGHSAFNQQQGPSGGGGGFGDFDFSDIFGDIFGGGSQSRQNDPNRPRQGRDIEQSILLTFKEAAFGVKKDIKTKVEKDCKVCHGSGAKNKSDIKTCSTCRGQGKVQKKQRTVLGMMMTEAVCPSCHGQGKTIKNPCSNCHGQGRDKYEETISINFPAGVENDAYMRVTGKGEDGYNGARAGDLFINVRVQNDDFFKQEGLNIKVNIPVSFTQAALGGVIEIPTIHGGVDLKIPAGTQSESVLRIKHKGIHASSGKKGDQYAKVKIQVPTKVSAKEKKILKELSENETTHAEQTGFFDNIKNIFHK